MKIVNNRLRILIYLIFVAQGVMTCAAWIRSDEQHVCEEIVEATTQEIMQNSQKRSFGSLGHNFTAFTANDILGIPPDMECGVGPTQVIGMINGWIRSFNKTTGRADNVLNIDLSQFFAPIARNQDPFDVRIRFDRLTNRWFMLCENKGPSNQMYIAVSDGPSITQYSKWRFFKFTIGSPGIFADYPTLGIDAQALYVGVALFTEPGGLNQGARAFVLPKAPFVSGGTPSIFVFNNLTDVMGNGAGVPQGVNNFDAGATTGYFIGTNETGEGLVLYRISNPGTMPSISSPIVITAGVPSYVSPISVPTLNGVKIDGGDTRLLCAHIRNNRLWTVHGVGVNNVGDSSDDNTVTRNGCRWYEIDIIPALPTVVQTGILFTASPTNSTNQRSYIFPSLMTSGQNHMVVGCTAAGSTEFINAALACRAATDAPGTLRAPVLYTASSTAYNFKGSDRWGDYSYVALDPSDDMTMWAIQEFCSGVNEWGCRVVQVKAPPPATPISATSVSSGQASTNTTVTGMSVNGSGFFDPGAGFAKRISAQVAGGSIVNSVTYVSPTQVILNLNTSGVLPGNYNVTIINPDGQQLTGVGILTIT
jgi:hypothetical protein